MKKVIVLFLVLILVGCSSSQIENKEEITGETIKEVEKEKEIISEEFTLFDGDSFEFNDLLIEVAVFPKKVVFNVDGNVIPEIKENEKFNYEDLTFEIKEIAAKKTINDLVADQVEFTLTYVSDEFGRLKETETLKEGTEKVYSFPDREIPLEVKIISSKNDEPFVSFIIDGRLTDQILDGESVYLSDDLKIFIRDIEDNDESIVLYSTSFKISSEL